MSVYTFTDSIIIARVDSSRAILGFGFGFDDFDYILIVGYANAKLTRMRRRTRGAMRRSKALSRVHSTCLSRHLRGKLILVSTNWSLKINGRQTPGLGVS